MNRFPAIFVVSIFLGGCASSPLSSVSNLKEKNLGEVTELVFDWNKKVNQPDESEKLRHWKSQYARLFNDPQAAKSHLYLMANYYESYCSALDGEFVKARDLQSDQTVVEASCKKKGSDLMSFRLVVGYRALAAWQRQSWQNGACVWLSPKENGHSLGCHFWIDAFQWKSAGEYEDVERTYKIDNQGYTTIAKADAATQARYTEATLRTKQMQEDVEKKMQQQKEMDRLLQERTIRDLPQVKIVGQKICRTVGISQRKVIGYALNQPVYSTPVNLSAKVTGFTENTSGAKIQVRISGIQIDGENVSRIDGDVVIENGTIIWDESTNWGLCYLP